MQSCRYKTLSNSYLRLRRCVRPDNQRSITSTSVGSTQATIGAFQQPQLTGGAGAAQRRIALAMPLNTTDHTPIQRPSVIRATPVATAASATATKVTANPALLAAPLQPSKSTTLHTRPRAPPHVLSIDPIDATTSAATAESLQQHQMRVLAKGAIRLLRRKISAVNPSETHHVDAWKEKRCMDIETNAKTLPVYQVAAFRPFIPVIKQAYQFREDSGGAAAAKMATTWATNDNGAKTKSSSMGNVDKRNASSNLTPKRNKPPAQKKDPRLIIMPIETPQFHVELLAQLVKPPFAFADIGCQSSDPIEPKVNKNGSSVMPIETPFHFELLAQFVKPPFAYKDAGMGQTTTDPLSSNTSLGGASTDHTLPPEDTILGPNSILFELMDATAPVKLAASGQLASEIEATSAEAFVGSAMSEHEVRARLKVAIEDDLAAHPERDIDGIEERIHSLAQLMQMPDEPIEVSEAQLAPSKRPATQKPNISTVKPPPPRKVEVDTCEHGYDLDGAPEPNCGEPPMPTSRQPQPVRPTFKKRKNFAHSKYEMDLSEHGYDLDGAPDPNCGEPPMPQNPRHIEIKAVEAQFNTVKFPPPRKVEVDTCTHDLEVAPKPNCGASPMQKKSPPKRPSFKEGRLGK